MKRLTDSAIRTIENINLTVEQTRGLTRVLGDYLAKSQDTSAEAIAICRAIDCFLLEVEEDGEHLEKDLLQIKRGVKGA